MNTYLHLAFVYFNDASPPLKFRVSRDILFVDLKSKLNTLVQYPENWRNVKLEYCSLSFNNEGKIQFTMLKLKTNEDLKVMWSTFFYYSTKGSIEVDATIARSTEDILKMLQCPEPPVCNDYLCNAYFDLNLCYFSIILPLFLDVSGLA
ncbi:unnamed protein product [Lathyrus sativus]|nr:unnamed protein product [Lathyrus sativus]